MASYFERYRQGEHVQVWQELVALGDRVRTEPHHSDAHAVAQETMRRVRHNVELVYSRLQGIGYAFQFPTEAVSPPVAGQIAEIDEFERQVGHVPLSLRAWAEVVGSVNFMGTYPKLSYCEREFNPFSGVLAAVMQDGQPQMIDFASLMPTQSDLDSIPPEFDGALSSIRGAFSNLFGNNSFTSDEKKKEFPGEDQTDLQQLEELGQEVASKMQRAFAEATNPRKANAEDMPEEDRVLSDPLVVQLSGLSTEQYEAWQEIEDDDIPFSVIIAPDIREKANRAGDASYEVYLPDAAADVLIRNTEGEDILFVEYLRSSFEWAGFRELRKYARRDEALLESLKEGLQPF